MIMDSQGAYITWSTNLRYNNVTTPGNSGTGAMIFANNRGLGSGGWRFNTREGTESSRLEEDGKWYSTGYVLYESGNDTGMYSGGDNVIQFKCAAATSLEVGAFDIKAKVDLYDKNNNLIQAGLVPDYISLNHNATPLTIGTSYTQINKLVDVEAVRGISRNAGRCTIAKTGIYVVSYTLMCQQTSGNNRAEIRAAIYRNGSIRGDTVTSGYSRNQTQEGASCAASYVASLSAGDVIDVRAFKDSGVAVQSITGNLSTHQIA